MATGSVVKAAAKVSSIGLVNSPRLISRVMPENPFSAAMDRSIPPISLKPINTSKKSLEASYSEKLEDWEFAEYEEIFSPISNDHLTPVFLSIPPSPTMDEAIAATGELNNDDFETSNINDHVTPVSGIPLTVAAEKIAAIAEVNDAQEIQTPTNDHLPPVLSTPPTFEEAIAATGELKDALETIFVSSPRSNGSLQESNHSTQSFQINEYRNKLSHASTSSTPTHAIHAFTILDGNPQIQGIVASIASDPRVWEAVLQNPSLSAYIQSHASSADRPGSVEGAGEETKYEESKYLDEEDLSSEIENIELKNIWKKIENGVIDMISSLSEYFKSLFGDQKVEKEEGIISDSTIIPHVVGPSLMGVIVLVILVVVLKRS